MAKPKLKWTPREEEALSAGVEKYGLGKWKSILTDPQFACPLANRSNVDLKDKWRNLSGGEYGSSSKGNVRTHLIEGEPSRSSVDKRRLPAYKTMIYEALSYFDDPKGTDVSTMVEYLEPKYDVTKNFRRLLSAKLRKLVLNGDLEKVDHRYKVKRMSSDAGTSRLEDVCTDDIDNFNEEQWVLQNCNEEQGEPLFTDDIDNFNEEQSVPQNCIEEQEEPLLTDTSEDAALVAAYMVYEAEKQVCELVKRCEEADKLDKLLEESMVMLILAQELHYQCAIGGVVILAP